MTTPLDNSENPLIASESPSMDQTKPVVKETAPAVEDPKKEKLIQKEAVETGSVSFSLQ